MSRYSQCKLGSGIHVYIATSHNNVNGMKFKYLNSWKSEQYKINGQNKKDLYN